MRKVWLVQTYGLFRCWVHRLLALCQFAPGGERAESLQQERMGRANNCLVLLEVKGMRGNPEGRE